MLAFSELLDIMSDAYQDVIDETRAIYRDKVINSVRYYVAKEYPTFTGNIYFEVNRDFLSVVALETSNDETFKNSEIQQNLHKNLCTLQPDLLQCLDDVQISI